ncbi:MAG: methyltransferase domain-containing protein [Chloroflexi bacterium]|nr:methyltransferase domain-containing protein [Chloroflexota bacterium]
MNESVMWKVTGTLPEIYEQVFVPAAMRRWATRLIDFLEMKHDQRILDIACGTGAATHLLAERCGYPGQVVGYDLSPEMLAIAQAKRPDTAIDWQLGDASHLPFLDESFEIVTCLFGFMFFEDRVANLREMYRVLAPGGQLAVLVWGAIERNPGFFAVAKGFGRHVSADASNSIRSSFVLGDIQQMQSIAAGADLRDASVQAISTLAHFPSVEFLVHGYGAMLQAEIDEATHSRLLNDIAVMLQAYLVPGGLVFPMEAILLHMRK